MESEIDLIQYEKVLKNSRSTIIMLFLINAGYLGYLLYISSIWKSSEFHLFSILNLLPSALLVILLLFALLILKKRPLVANLACLVVFGGLKIVEFLLTPEDVEQGLFMTLLILGSLLYNVWGLFRLGVRLRGLEK